MSKAEEYIVLASDENGQLCDTKALKAVDIAREETTEKIKQLLKENYLIKSVEPLRWVSWEKVFNDLKQKMKDDCK